jgi:hypothetical protein
MKRLILAWLLALAVTATAFPAFAGISPAAGAVEKGGMEYFGEDGWLKSDPISFRDIPDNERMAVALAMTMTALDFYPDTVGEKGAVDFTAGDALSMFFTMWHLSADGAIPGDGDTGAEPNIEKDENGRFINFEASPEEITLLANTVLASKFKFDFAGAMTPADERDWGKVFVPGHNGQIACEWLQGYDNPLILNVARGGDLVRTTVLALFATDEIHALRVWTFDTSGELPVFAGVRTLETPGNN